MLGRFFQRRKPERLHFALVLSNRDTSGLTFQQDRDAKLFIVTGECIEGDVIPRTTLRAAAERMRNGDQPPAPEGDIKISEQKV